MYTEVNRAFPSSNLSILWPPEITINSQWTSMKRPKSSTGNMLWTSNIPKKLPYIFPCFSLCFLLMKYEVWKDLEITSDMKSIGKDIMERTYMNLFITSIYILSTVDNTNNKIQIKVERMKDMRWMIEMNLY